MQKQESNNESIVKILSKCKKVIDSSLPNQKESVWVYLNLMAKELNRRLNHYNGMLIILSTQSLECNFNKKFKEY